MLRDQPSAVAHQPIGVHRQIRLEGRNDGREHARDPFGRTPGGGGAAVEGFTGGRGGGFSHYRSPWVLRLAGLLRQSIARRATMTSVSRRSILLASLPRRPARTEPQDVSSQG